MSTGAKQIIWGVSGVLYAFVYGLWTIMATGGGHGNFIWFFLFLSVNFCGLYFPIMAALAVDLRENPAMIAFGSLLGFNLLASVGLIIVWLVGIENDWFDPFEKAYAAMGLWGLLFCAVLHFLPSIFFSIRFITSLMWGSSANDDEGIALNLK